MAARTKAEPDALEAETRAGKDFTVAKLAGKDVRVKPIMEWRSSGSSALKDGDFELWAKGCLYGDDYAQVWKKVDPTIGEVNDFLGVWSKVSGQNPGD